MSGRTHAMERLRERFGIDATKADMRELVRTARSAGRLISRETHKDEPLFVCKTYAVIWRGHPMRVIVSDAGFVVTVLPSETPNDGAKND